MRPRLLQDVALPLARLGWAAAWRAQSLHLALFIVPPLLLLVGKGLMALALPLLVIVGPGDNKDFIGKASAHLREPRCWIALAACEYAERAVPGVAPLTGRASTTFKNSTRLEQARFVELPRELRWRHVWFLGWLIWFLLVLQTVDEEREEHPNDPSRPA